MTADAVAIAGMVRDTGLEKVRTAYNENAFLPTRIKVAAGAKVTWTNTGKEPHNATAQDGSWTTGDIAPGQMGSFTFTKAGQLHLYRQGPSLGLWASERAVSFRRAGIVLKNELSHPQHRV